MSFLRKLFTPLTEEEIDAFYSDEEDDAEEAEWWYRFTRITETGDVVTMVILLIIVTALTIHMAGVF